LTTSTSVAWRRKDYFRNHKVVMMKMNLISGDTVATCVTGLKKIYCFNVAPPQISGKALDHSTVAGGTITVNFADPVANAALYVTATGI
jgi:hypothetical protein